MKPCWAVLSTQSLLRVVFCHNAVRVNFKHDIGGNQFTLIILTSGRTLTIKPADISEITVVSAFSFE